MGKPCTDCSSGNYLPSVNDDFLTGDTLSPDSMRFVEQCGQPWIPKPCSIAEVRTAMAQVLQAPMQDAPDAQG